MPSHRTGTPEDMDRLATFLEANPFASAMMIHQGPHGEQRGVAGGTKVSGSYFGAATYASESTMVHWAPSSGGTPLQGGVGTTPQSPVYTRSADPEKKSGGNRLAKTRRRNRRSIRLRRVFVQVPGRLRPGEDRRGTWQVLRRPVQQSAGRRRRLYSAAAAGLGCQTSSASSSHPYPRPVALPPQTGSPTCSRTPAHGHSRPPSWTTVFTSTTTSSGTPQTKSATKSAPFRSKRPASHGKACRPDDRAWRRRRQPRTMMPRGKDSHVHCCTCAAATTFARRNNSYTV